ncbi:MAG: M20 family metallo-hydrolase, partial [Actinobacteria bacterium]|nr:M20 family metallo-hydrolase [Actinomycetota bacterium]NIU66237.1 M20 family metallo-hydrolase [Actinomycetota bacterium]NIW28054.1 Zn-dependent hydrolase [Actinomycetota bacterium]
MLRRIDEMARIGAIEGGGVCRLALGEADGRARDLVVEWMRSLGLEVTVDAIGNIVGVRPGTE